MEMNEITAQMKDRSLLNKLCSSNGFNPFSSELVFLQGIIIQKILGSNLEKGVFYSLLI